MLSCLLRVVLSTIFNGYNDHVVGKKIGAPVERAVLYDKGYRRKDGTPVVDRAAENIVSIFSINPSWLAYFLN